MGAESGRDFKDIGLDRIGFITIPVVDSTSRPGRVEPTSEAHQLWDRVRHDRPLGRLRDGSGELPYTGLCS